MQRFARPRLGAETYLDRLRNSECDLQCYLGAHFHQSSWSTLGHIEGHRLRMTWLRASAPLYVDCHAVLLCWRGWSKTCAHCSMLSAKANRQGGA